MVTIVVGVVGVQEGWEGMPTSSIPPHIVVVPVVLVSPSPSMVLPKPMQLGVEVTDSLVGGLLELAGQVLVA
jgi:hypothetical protein